MSTLKKAEAECGACGGTGLYNGMCEPEGVAVVCLRCRGTGCEVITWTAFEGRKPSRGIKTVQRSRGSFIGTGVGPVGKSITYKEFKEGKMPE